MELKITPAVYGRKVASYAPDNSIYKELGEDGMRKMISDFYDLLVASPIKDIFPTTNDAIIRAKQHSSDFFIQRFGGPDYFQQNRGAPMMNRRHAPFEITPEGRDEWLKCFREVLLKLEIKEKTIQDFWIFLDTFSTHMINTPSKKPKFIFGA